MIIREMKLEDYDNVFALWKTIKGFGIRSVDDSREGIERFLKWNPGLSVVAEEDGKIVAHTAVYAECENIAIEGGLIVDENYKKINLKTLIM